MAELAERISLISESQTIKMARLYREMAANGGEMINLSLGEPDFVTPGFIREAAKKAIDEGYTFYTPIAGYADLREAIAEKFKRENGLDFSASQVVVSTGAKQSIINVVLSLAGRGDEVLIPAPYWVSYVEMVRIAEAELRVIDTTVETEFKISAEQLEDAITEKTKLFIFSSPCNPTGSVYNREELAALAEVFARHENVIIISDEIYEHINFTGKHQSIAQFESLKNRVVVANGVSKAYAMTGWRIGYIGAPAEIAAACDKIQGQFTSGASSISQRAALAALQGSRDEIEKMRNIFEKRRNLVVEGIRKIKGLKTFTPAGAFYVFPDVRFYFGKSNENYTIKNADDLCMYLLKVAGVSVVSGRAFGNNNCIRISYATSEDKLERALEKIGSALEALG